MRDPSSSVITWMTPIKAGGNAEWQQCFLGSHWAKLSNVETSENPVQERRERLLECRCWPQPTQQGLHPHRLLTHLFSRCDSSVSNLLLHPKDKLPQQRLPLKNHYWHIRPMGWLHNYCGTNTLFAIWTFNLNTFTLFFFFAPPPTVYGLWMQNTMAYVSRSVIKRICL